MGVTVNHWLVEFDPLMRSQVLGLKVFTDAHMPVTHKEGDRYPLRPPGNKAGVTQW
jgi:hypothetical protein